MIKPGSLISIKVSNEILGTYYTIALVDKIEGNFLYCSNAITSKDYGEFKSTRDIINSYQGEFSNGVKLVDADEFDIVVDTKIINRKNLKNL